jgi:hypothetical protein
MKSLFIAYFFAYTNPLFKRIILWPLFLAEFFWTQFFKPFFKTIKKQISMKPGDKVVCIETTSTYSEWSKQKWTVYKGQIYTIQNVMTCCDMFYLDVGFVSKIPVRCPKCSKNMGHIVWAGSILFRPIQYISAHEELLKKETIVETSDQPIEEPKKQEA